LGTVVRGGQRHGVPLGSQFLRPSVTPRDFAPHAHDDTRWPVIELGEWKLRGIVEWSRGESNPRPLECDLCAGP